MTYEGAHRTSDLLAASLQSRNSRLEAQDMLSVDEAAACAGTTRAEVEGWITGGRCIRWADAEGAYRLPEWQFEPSLWPLVPKLFEAPE